LANFVAPDKDNFLFGMEAGEVTDGTSQALLLADVLMHEQHNLVSATYFNALQTWLEKSEFAKFVGPSTARALKDGSPSPEDNVQGSNGAAMRTAPIGWFCASDPNRAVDLSIGTAAITHTGTAVIGAAMISSAVSVAISGGSLDKLLTAAYDAIDQVDRQMQIPRSAAVMKKAFNHVSIVGERTAACGSLPQRLEAFTYPTSTLATGSVIAAIGCVIACPNNPFNALTLAINAGDDTHTTAMMTGAISGAMVGQSMLPPDLTQQLDEVNKRLHKINLQRTADQIAETPGRG
jgi:ADP-ribosylglycohydrolase